MTKDASFDLWRASAINPCNSLMFLFWRNLKLNFTLTLSECQAPNLSSLSAGVFERSPTSKFCKLNKKNRKIKVIELSISNSCR